MPIKTPCLKDLQALIADPKYTGNNPKRLSLIALSKQLHTLTLSSYSAEEIINVLMSELVLEYEDIEKEYERWIFSPEKNHSWWDFGGSTRYTLLKEKLNIHKGNEISASERLSYLGELLQFLIKHYPEENIQKLKDDELIKKNRVTPIWKSKQDLCKWVEHRIEKRIDKNHDDIYALIHCVPILSALFNSMNKFESEYLATSSNPTNPDRLAALNFLKFIQYSYSQQGTNTSDVFLHICSGSILVVLLRIEAECTFFNPRSKQFQILLRALNQESLKAIPIDDKIKWLTAILGYLVIFSADKEKYQKTLNEVIVHTKKQKLTIENMDAQIKDFQKHVEHHLMRLKKEKESPTPSWTSWAISKSTSYGVLYVASPTIINTATKMVLDAINLSLCVTGTPVALFSGIAGTLLMTDLGRLIAEGAITTASAGLFAWILANIGNKVGDVTAAVVTYPFSITPKGLEEMRMKLKPDDDMDFVNMVNTILKLDMPHKIDPKDKDRIREVLNLKPGEFLQPLKSTLLHQDKDKEMQAEIRVNGFACRTLV